MPKKILMIILGSCFLFGLAGCSLSLLGSPTSLVMPTPTALPSSTTPAPPTATATLVLPTITPGIPYVVTTMVPPVMTMTVMPTASGIPSGPYGVILVDEGDVLNIRSSPGANNAVIGSFTANAISIMLTGPASMVDGAQWVQVQYPSGGTGWVNFIFLSEYVPPVDFCVNASASTLITNLDMALQTSNGELLASLVSPAHGMDVRLWRYGTVINYDREHARWVFDSTYVHNWGPDGASGLDTIGSFPDVVLPKLQDVFDASYTLGCNDPGIAASFSLQPWPPEYSNINYYSVLKPGTPGVDLDFRLWLVGIEYVRGQPYIFSLIHFQWEP